MRFRDARNNEVGGPRRNYRRPKRYSIIGDHLLNVPSGLVPSIIRLRLLRYSRNNNEVVARLQEFILQSEEA